MPTIRPYKPTDKPALLALFDQNTPPYFAPHERTDFADFLDNQLGEYFVIENDDHTIVACGGYWLNDTAPFAVLTWDIVARDLQRQGVGRLLIETCLQDLRAIPNLERVVLTTSQYSYPFFEKFGFSITAIQESGFGPGLDIYSMELFLNNPTPS